MDRLELFSNPTPDFKTRLSMVREFGLKTASFLRDYDDGLAEAMNSNKVSDFLEMPRILSRKAQIESAMPDRLADATGLAKEMSDKTHQNLKTGVAASQLQLQQGDTDDVENSNEAREEIAARIRTLTAIEERNFQNNMIGNTLALGALF